MNCENCGKDTSDMRAGTRFCSVSCRSSYHQKKKRREASRLNKSLLYRATEKLDAVMPKAAIWLVLVFCVFLSFAYAADSVAIAYREHEIRKQSEDLIELRQKYNLVKNSEKSYLELNHQFETSKQLLDVLLDAENGWLQESEIHEFKSVAKQKLKELNLK